jgi:hypothetical protein
MLSKDNRIYFPQFSESELIFAYNLDLDKYVQKAPQHSPVSSYELGRFSVFLEQKRERKLDIGCE